MKVVGSVGSSGKTASEIDLEIDGLSQSVRKEIVDEVGTLLVEQVLLSLGDAKSPVSGESFPALSRRYKKLKEEQGGSGVPDLELTGALKDSLTYRATDRGLEIGFFDDQADKADGHLKFSGRKNETPKRRFLPEEGQNFKRDIVRQVEDIIDSKAGDLFSKSDFGGVESSSNLYDVLRMVYGGYGRLSIREAVASNSNLMSMLIDLDLVKYL